MHSFATLLTVLFVALGGCTTINSKEPSTAEMINKLANSEIEWVSFTEEKSNKYVQFSKDEVVIFAEFPTFFAQSKSVSSRVPSYSLEECVEKAPRLNSDEFNLKRYLSNDEINKLVNHFRNRNINIQNDYCKAVSPDGTLVGHAGSITAVFDKNEEITDELLASIFSEVFGVKVTQPLKIDFE